MIRRIALIATIFAACLAGAGEGAYAAVPPDQPAGQSTPPAVQPQSESAKPQPESSKPPAPAPARTTRMNNRCDSPAMNCILFDAQPAGSSCWCVTPFGPSYGRVP